MSERTLNKNYITHKELKDTKSKLEEKMRKIYHPAYQISGDELFEELGLNNESE